MAEPSLFPFLHTKNEDEAFQRKIWESRCPELLAQTDELRRLTYDKTPVDCLLSDLLAAWECGYLNEAYWKGRMTEFRAEVEPDAV